MEESISLNINNNFHEVLHNIDDFFWFYLLSNGVLADPEVQNLIRAKSMESTDISFLPMLDRYNEWVNLQTKIDGITKKYTTEMNILNGVIIVGKIMTISVYELLLSSKYYLSIKNLEEFKFLKHIRNGAAHNNRFDFKNKKGDWTLGENEVITWQNYKIDRSLQGKTVFNDFISFSIIFVLADHFSEKLKQIDKTIKT